MGQSPLGTAALAHQGHSSQTHTTICRAVLMETRQYKLPDTRLSCRQDAAANQKAARCAVVNNYFEVSLDAVLRAA
jgi:hypothetical protein